MFKPYLPKYKTRAQGFTLIEVLIALFVFTFVAMIIGSVLYTILTARGQIQTLEKRLAQLQLAQVILQRDLTQISVLPIYRRHRVSAPLMGASHTLRFVRGGYVNPLGIEPRSTLLEVSYRLDAKQHLLRVTQAGLYRYHPNPVQQQVLLDNVKAFTVYYFDAAHRRYSIWPPNRQLLQRQWAPTAIEVELQLAHWGRLRQFYQLATLS